MKAVGIKWDTDGDMDLLNELPDEIELPDDVVVDGEIDYQAVDDYLSDYTGFCHDGYEIEE